MKHVPQQKHASLPLRGNPEAGLTELPLKAKLETLPNAFPNRGYWIRIDSPEPTVRCDTRFLKEDNRITCFEVRAVNQKSIHNHSAFAVISSPARHGCIP